MQVKAAHEDGRGDYSAEVGALAAGDAEALVVIGHVDQGGSGIVRAALDTGAFGRFVFADGMMHTALFDAFGKDITGRFGTIPGTGCEGAASFESLATLHGVARRLLQGDRDR